MIYRVERNSTAKGKFKMNRKFLLTTLVAYMIFGLSYATENTNNPTLKLNKKFIENLGQINAENAPSDIKFYIQRGLMNVYFLEDRVSYVLRTPNKEDELGTRLDLTFGNTATPQLFGLGGQQSSLKFYTLDCQSGAEVMEYNKIVYENIYKNIDLVYYLNDKGALKYDFIVHPGGDPSDIQINYEGDADISLLEDGRVELSSTAGFVYEAAPYTYLKEDQQEVSTSYILKKKQLKFQIAEYDTEKTLVIDPEVEWSTFYGGESFDDGINSTTDRFGNVYVTGKTYSLEFPNISSAFGNGEKGDIVIGKFNAAGSHLWTIYYGGDAESEGLGITTDDAGNVFVTGMTKSFYIPNPQDPNNPHEASGNEDVVLLKVAVDGSPIRVTTFGSFNGADVGHGIEFDGDGLYLTGTTSTSEVEFPVTPGTHQVVKNEDLDAFLMRLDRDMNIIWATYLGGSRGDEAYGIAVDDAGDPYITGATNSPDLPFNTNPFTPGSTIETTDAFVAKFNKANGTLIWLEYFGGTQLDVGEDIVAYRTDLVYVVGTTQSTNFEIVNQDTLRTFQDTYGGGGTDGFILQLDANTGSPRWTTYLGGSDDDHIKGVTTTGGAEVIVTGYTESQNFPTVNTDDAVKGTFQGGEEDAFITLISDAGQVRYSGYIGGSNIDIGRDISFFRGATEDENNVYVIGRTRSADFPTIGNSYQENYNGGADIFIYTLGAVIDSADVDQPVPSDTIPTIFCDNVRNNVISLNPLFEDIFANQCLEDISPNTVVYYGSTPRIVDGGDFQYLYQISPNDRVFENVRDEDGNLAMNKNLTLGEIDLQRYFNLNDTLWVRRIVITAACVDGSGSEVITEQDFQFSFPDFTFDANCKGQVIQLTDDSNISGSSITSYTYTVTAGSTVETFTDANPEIGPYNVNSVEVSLEITSDEGCVGTETKTINLADAPQANFEIASNDQNVICLNNNVVFTSTSTVAGDIVNYEWNINGETTFSGPDQDEVSFEFTSGGDKTISLTITTSSGCTSTTSQTFTASENEVLESPTVDAGSDQEISRGVTIELNPNVVIPSGQELAASLWTSNPPGAFVGQNINPNALITGAQPSEDSYLTLTVTTNLGCQGQDSLLVEVREPGAGDIPNVFTPNGDGFNDVFQIDILKNEPGAKVQIFNRWGSLVYSTFDYFNNPWDGRYNGEPAPAGVYYYVITFPDNRNEIEGSVTLLR